MKKLVSKIGIFAFLSLFVFAACQQGGDITEELADIRESNMEIIQNIDEAMAMTDMSDFKDQVEEALNNLDDQIENYHTEMDNANRRVDAQARDAIISLKEKMAAVEFKLELMDEGDTWGGNDQDTSWTETDETTDPTTTTATDDTTGMGTTGRMDQDEVNYPQLFEEVKSDLQQLRDDLQTFNQNHL